MQIALENMKLALWEKRTLDDRTRDPVSGEWVKTGTKVEKTLYTVRDEFGETLKFLANNDYRDFEGKPVRVTLEIVFNDYDNKVQTRLAQISLMESAKK